MSKFRFGSAAPNEFNVTLRGFDQQQVDTLVECAKSGQVTAAEVRSTSFDVVLRGYDRAEVATFTEILATSLDEGA